MKCTSGKHLSQKLEHLEPGKRNKIKYFSESKAELFFNRDTLYMEMHNINCTMLRHWKHWSAILPGFSMVTTSKVTLRQHQSITIVLAASHSLLSYQWNLLHFDRGKGKCAEPRNHDRRPGPTVTTWVSAPHAHSWSQESALLLKWQIFAMWKSETRYEPSQNLFKPHLKITAYKLECVCVGMWRDESHF